MIVAPITARSATPPPLPAAAAPPATARDGTNREIPAERQALPVTRARCHLGAVGAMADYGHGAGTMPLARSSDPALVCVQTPGVRYVAETAEGPASGIAPMGSLFLVAPGRSVVFQHRIPFALRSLTLAAAAVPDLTGAPDAPPLRALSRGHFQSPAIRSLIDGLWLSCVRDDVESERLAASVVRFVVAELLRIGARPVAKQRGGLAPWQVRRATDRLCERLPDALSLEALAASVGLSLFHFCRAFKQSLGVPPHRYRILARLAQARAQLETTDRPITDIAVDVGYESSQALSRIFRQELGLSPSEVRRVRSL